MHVPQMPEQRAFSVAHPSKGERASPRREIRVLRAVILAPKISLTSPGCANTMIRYQLFSLQDGIDSFQDGIDSISGSKAFQSCPLSEITV
jgi:hypothetical protein